MQMVESVSRSKTNLFGPLTLQLGSSIPSNPFVNNSFPVQLYLLDGQKQLLQGYNIPVEMQVYLQGADIPLPLDEVCNIEPKQLCISNLGFLEFQCTFKQLSMDHGHRKFYLKFLVRFQDIPDMHGGKTVLSSTNNDEYATISSHPIFVIRHRLLIHLDIPNQFPAEETVPTTTSAAIYSSNPPEATAMNGKQHIWYKDEGGKDHGIDILITLINENYEPIVGHEIPLILTLTYANGENITMKSNLLNILPEGSLIIDKHTGKLLKKIRINDISKNHQRQSFRIRVQPDVSKANTASVASISSSSISLFDIAGDESEAIEVRSKRTKRQRDALLSSSSNLAILPLPNNTGSISTSHKQNNANIPIVESTNNSGIGTTNLLSSNKRFKSGNTSKCSDEDGQISPPPTIPLALSKSSKVFNSSSQLLNTDRSFHPNHNNRAETISTSTQSHHPINNISNNTSSSATTINSPFISGNNVHELDVEQSFRAVLKWTENVIHGLQEMQWVPLGFPSSQPPTSSLTGGNKIDWSKPYYQMNNPNLLIEKLLTEYSNQVYNALSILVKKRESFPHHNNSSHSTLKQQVNGQQVNHGNINVASSLHNPQNHSISNNIPPSFNPGYSMLSSASDSGKKRMIGKGRNHHANGSHGSFPNMAGSFPSNAVTEKYPGNALQEEDGFEDNSHSSMPNDEQYRQDWYNVINFIEQNNAQSNPTSSSPLAPASKKIVHNSKSEHSTRSHGSNSVLNSSALVEENVFYILSLPYDFQKQEIISTPPNPLDEDSEKNHHELYFPAFDQHLLLLGFYTETKDSRDATIINFIPLSSPLFFQETVNVKDLQDVLQVRLRNQAPEVYSLDNANNDLEVLKQNAIVHYWLSEVGLDDEF